MNDQQNNLKGSKMYGNAALNTYTQNNLGIESPAKLISMLYEGILRFNAQAKKEMKNKNVEKSVYWMNRSVAIITELINILDMKQGQIAKYLEGMYNYQLTLLSESIAEKSIDKIDECSNVFRTLLEVWRETTDVA